MPQVKCSICNIHFDRDKEPFEMTSSRRYAHRSCYEKMQSGKTQEEKDYESLEKCIMKIFGKDYLGSKIQKQIRDYRRDYNFSFDGMQKTLHWWFDVKGHTVEETNGGIGIIPYIYEDACRYYYNLFLAQIANEDAIVNNIQVIEIEIPPPKVPEKLPKLFNF